jgi:hypothetical protein
MSDKKHLKAEHVDDTDVSKASSNAEWSSKYLQPIHKAFQFITKIWQVPGYKISGISSWNILCILFKIYKQASSYMIQLNCYL